MCCDWGNASSYRRRPHCARSTASVFPLSSDMALHLRLPSLLVESHSKNSATDGKEEVVKVLERVRDRLRELKSKRPRPSRPKRKKKPPLIGEEGKEKKNEGETEEKEDEACELEKEIREKKAVKKEKIKKENKKNKSKKENRKAEASKEEKEKEMKEAALETTNGQKRASLSKRLSYRIPQVN